MDQVLVDALTKGRKWQWIVDTLRKGDECIAGYAMQWDSSHVAQNMHGAEFSGEPGGDLGISLNREQMLYLG